jgi:hypothetical protein
MSKFRYFPPPPPIILDFFMKPSRDPMSDARDPDLGRDLSLDTTGLNLYSEGEGFETGRNAS